MAMNTVPFFVLNNCLIIASRYGKSLILIFCDYQVGIPDFRQYVADGRIGGAYGRYLLLTFYLHHGGFRRLGFRLVRAYRGS